MIKNLFTTLLVVFTTSTCTMAQKVTDQIYFGDIRYPAIAIPSEFSYNDTPVMTLYDDKNTVSILDENLDVKKTISLKNLSFNYQLEYKKEERDVTAVKELGNIIRREYSSYENFLSSVAAEFSRFDGTQLSVTNLDNGDKKIVLDYEVLVGYNLNDYYDAYNYFGKKYPKQYYIQHDEKVTQYYGAQYSVSYSDWNDVGTITENKTKELSRISLVNVNLNKGEYRAIKYFEVSQTLFNDDDSYEYLVPKLKLAKIGNVGGSVTTDISTGSNENIETTRTTCISDEKQLALAGFQVVSENGTVIKDIDFDINFEVSIDLSIAYVISIGKNIYLAFDGKGSNYSQKTIFFKIDHTTSSIQQAKSVPAALMQIVPTVAKSGSEINVNFGDDNKDGSQIEVISASGAKVKSMNVPAGQKSAQFSVHRASGLYCVSRVQKNQPRETKKIIIK